MTDRKFVSKSWGYEDWIVNNDKYCGKVLFFKKDKSCSLHYHKLKEETFYVQSGKLFVYYYNNPSIDSYVHKPDLFNSMHGAILLSNCYNPITKQTDDYKIDYQILEEGDSFHVPIGMRHRMTGLLDTVMFEFSTHHEDSDSYRIIPL